MEWNWRRNLLPGAAAFSSSPALIMVEAMEAMDSDDDKNEDAIHPSSCPFIPPGGINSRLGNTSSGHSK
jgi:hypothetical protein